MPADRAATGRDSEADTAANTDTAAKADTSTKTKADASMKADAAGRGAEGAPAVQDNESHGTSAAGASVPEQEPTGAEPEAGQAPDAKPDGTEPSGAESPGTDQPGTDQHGTEPHADEGDSGEADSDGTPAEDAEAGADAVREGEPTARDAVSAPGPDGRPRRTTRRFPLFTRDTARPEGGGRAAPRDAPAPARQWPILAVIGTVGLGLLLTALDLFKVGTLLIGVALLAGGVMRWTLPDVGMLAVRSRFTDLVTYGVLGVTIVLLAMMAQPNPLLEIPFLDDTLHFTIRT
ncbi:DUF3017 domain-containing protein [Streptomyces sp. ActVer]|uniref:DUF3017 domain-containing protein n=1 Tax=Streptomyces sp. ActVer TaxID=3014558 RepID=UPI0022B531B1|nr:DUF3017 domain-containing protein [Streptomyces sp. ActVer]MCZ4511614.1 DUF3017 domain-containing protein [Streptomyces sp. ActVer]